MPERVLPDTGMDEQALRAEIERLNKIIRALMDRAERSTAVQTASGFSLLQTTVTLEAQIRLRTAELDSVLRENEKVTRALRESEMKFQGLVEQSLVGITLSDGQRFSYVNPKFAEMSGYGIDELLQMGLFGIMPAEDRPMARKLIRELLSGKSEALRITGNIRRRDGSIMIVDMYAAPPFEFGGKPAIVAVFSDVTEKMLAIKEIKALNARLREQAIRDSLTGLFNRRYMEETLERELLRAERQTLGLSLIMGDIDHFKEINDLHGHQAGDAVLRSIGSLLARHARGSDICCRYGGEEFLLVLPDMEMAMACERAEALRCAIAKMPVEYGGEALRISASFGVAAFPAHGADGAKLISAADSAMYRAKAGGRNRVECG